MCFGLDNQDMEIASILQAPGDYKDDYDYHKYSLPNLMKLCLCLVHKDARVAQ